MIENPFLRGYRLTLAELIYRMPDYPDILQTFIWQELDIAPKFPVLSRFVTFWQKNLDGKIYSIRVSWGGLGGYRKIDAEYLLGTH